jgi:hypothetical protein
MCEWIEWASEVPVRFVEIVAGFPPRGGCNLRRGTETCIVTVVPGFAWFLCNFVSGHIRERVKNVPKNNRYVWLLFYEMCYCWLSIIIIIFIGIYKVWIYIAHPQFYIIKTRSHLIINFWEIVINKTLLFGFEIIHTMYVYFHTYYQGQLVHNTNHNTTSFSKLATCFDMTSHHLQGRHTKHLKTL